MGFGNSATPSQEDERPGQGSGGRLIFGRDDAQSLPRATRAAATTALTFLAFAVLWIIFSDRLLLTVVGTTDAERLTRLQTVKGWIFMFASAAGLFVLVRRSAASIEIAQRQAERSNRAKDQFLTILSHELRTPLTPALLNASALRSDPKLPADARETAAEIAEQIMAEARMIDDLLDVSGIASGKIHIDRRPVDLHALIHRVANALRSTAEAKSLHIERRLDAADCVVTGDEFRLEQVVRNVLGNAIKFTPHNGRVTVATSVSDRQLVIEVTDTGVGISPELMKRLFHPFEQADRTISRQFGGLGLGLSLCRHLLELHDGTITATSEGEGRGACFRITLPLAAPAAPAVAVSNGQPFGEAGVPLRILLVEDDRETRSAMAVLLRSMGHSVITAGCVIDAERCIHNSGSIDVLITDIRLPDGNGRDLLEPARLRHGAAGIAMSGLAAPEDVERSLEMGFSCHLVKPFVPSQVSQALQHCSRLLQRA